MTVASHDAKADPARILKACALHVIGPARVVQTQLQVAQHFLTDVNREWSVFIVPHD